MDSEFYPYEKSFYHENGAQHATWRSGLNRYLQISWNVKIRRSVLATAGKLVDRDCGRRHSDV